MSITFAASASATATTSGSAKQVKVPTQATTGRFMLLEYSGSQTQPDSNPTGWTLIRQAQGGTVYGTWWYRIATSTDAGSTVTVTADSNAKTALTLTVYAGVSTSAPIAVSNTKAETTSSSTHADPFLALPGGYSGKVVRSLALKDAVGTLSTAWAPPSGVVRVSASTGGTSGTTSVQSDSNESASDVVSSPGVWTVTGTGGAVSTLHAVTFAVALTPSSTPPPTPTRLTYQRSGASLRKVTLARREGSTVALL